MQVQSWHSIWLIFSYHKSVLSSKGMDFQFLASNGGEQNVQQDLLIGQTGGKSRLGPWDERWGLRDSCWRGGFLQTPPFPYYPWHQDETKIRKCKWRPLTVSNNDRFETGTEQWLTWYMHLSLCPSKSSLSVPHSSSSSPLRWWDLKDTWSGVVLRDKH